MDISFLKPELGSLEAYKPGFRPDDITAYVKLNTNENPFPPSPRVISALGNEVLSSLRLYSDPSLGMLKQAIAKTEGVSADCVSASNGSDEILALCFHGFCPDGAVFADETYGFYRVFCDMFGIKSTVIPLRDDFSLCTEDYESAKGTVFIANPNAPTGLFVEPEKLFALAKKNPKRLVIVDEAYIDFGGRSAIPFIAEAENLLVIRTFSKSRSLAGARVGYAVGSKGVIADLERLRNSFNPYNVNTLSLIAAREALLDSEYFESTRRRIIANRAMLTSGLRAMNFEVTDSLANFVFAKAPKGIPGFDLYSQLMERKILVRHFAHERIKDYVRISVGSEDDCARLLLACGDIVGR